MSPKEFFTIVVEMRQAQKNYFKTRNQGYLHLSKQFEKQIDAEIDRVLKLKTEPELNFK